MAAKIAAGYGENPLRAELNNAPSVIANANTATNTTIRNTPPASMPVARNGANFHVPSAR